MTKELLQVNNSAPKTSKELTLEINRVHEYWGISRVYQADPKIKVAFKNFKKPNITTAIA